MKKWKSLIHRISKNLNLKLQSVKEMVKLQSLKDTELKAIRLLQLSLKMVGMLAKMSKVAMKAFTKTHGDSTEMVTS